MRADARGPEKATASSVLACEGRQCVPASTLPRSASPGRASQQSARAPLHSASIRAQGWERGRSGLLAHAQLRRLIGRGGGQARRRTARGSNVDIRRGVAAAAPWLQRSGCGCGGGRDGHLAVRRCTHLRCRDGGSGVGCRCGRRSPRCGWRGRRRCRARGSGRCRRRTRGLAPLVAGQRHRRGVAAAARGRRRRGDRCVGGRIGRAHAARGRDVVDLGNVDGCGSRSSRRRCQRQSRAHLAAAGHRPAAQHRCRGSDARGRVR